MFNIKNLAFAMCFTLAAPAFAATPPVVVTDVHCSAAFKGSNVPVYFTSSTSDKSETLVGASSPVASSTVLMTGINDMQMKGFKGAKPAMLLMMSTMQTKAMLPASTATDMLHQWSHVMLIKINRDLVKGQVFPVTFNFKKTGQLVEKVIVQ
jgi:copper(I)-binding protein